MSKDKGIALFAGQRKTTRNKKTEKIGTTASSDSIPMPIAKFLPLLITYGHQMT
jgi:hypothetical protein